jgi:hypothetical protein
MQTKKFGSALSIVMLAVFSTFMSISFQSCTKEELLDDSDEQNELNLPVVGKWTVGNQDAEYGSFEFTVDKKYIISQRVSTPPSRSATMRSTPETVYIIIIFGDIASLSNSGNEYTLNLSEFGTITIRINPEQGTATVTVNGETYTVTKEKEMAGTTTLDLLCHTWNFEGYNGEYEGDESDDYVSGTLTFTKSGTYLISGIDEDGREVHEQNTFKLLSSNKIRLTIRVIFATGINGETIIEEYEEITDYTIKKLTESECVLYWEGEEEYDGSNVTINMTR